MRLTTVILIAAIMQVSANSFAQKISLTKKNAKLVEIFNQISVQTGYDFLFTASTLNGAKPVSINVKNANLSDVLIKIFEGQPLEFDIQDEFVVISRKENSIIDHIKDKINDLLQQSIDVTIMLKDLKGEPLPGGIATILSTRQVFRANEKGIIILKINKDEKVRFSYLGYKSQEIMISTDVKKERQDITVTLEQNPVDLNEVSIISNGYQDIDKTRTTGAYEQITAKQLQHSTDPNLINRLKGITTSLDFGQTVGNVYQPTSSSDRNFGRSPLLDLTIRGKNTLNAVVGSGGIGSTTVAPGFQNLSGIPLVVIDGIASPYPIEQVNPENVASISILKDAASASIWGARAANGVIVIKTKRGNFETPIRISFNSNFNITDKIDLFYNKRMSMADFIAAQVLIYNNTYNPNNPAAYLNDPTNVNSAQRNISPVAEIMNTWKKSNGAISIAQRDAELAALAQNDIRSDQTKYLLRAAVNQNYSLSVSSGSKNVTSSLFAGYNNILNNTVGSSSNNLNLGYNASMRPVKNLNINAGITYAQSIADAIPGQNAIAVTGTGLTLYPYSKLADDEGNALAIPKQYRPAFINLLNATYGSNLLDYTYKPLDDIKEGYYKTKNQNIGLNLSADYTFSPLVKASVTYNWNKSLTNLDSYNSKDSWYMRDMINRYSNGRGNRNIPLGGYLDQGSISSNNQTIQGQMVFSKAWEKHELNAMAGVDISMSYSLRHGSNAYGYDPKSLASYSNIDYKDNVGPLFQNSGLIEYVIPQSAYKDFLDYRTRTLGQFASASYTYLQRYTLEATVRKDGNSAFGEGTNKTGTPFYSFGTSWNINNESFYKFELIPSLKLRATFGYNGNVNPSVLAYSTVSYPFSIDPQTGFQVTGLSGANNPQLRPEKTGVLNLALDFGFKGARLSGSLDYYRKITTDLLMNNSIDPSTGFKQLTFNTANLKGQGIDLTLNSVNIKTSKFSWNTTLLAAYNRVIVTKLYVPAAETVEDVTSGGSRPFNVGADLTRIFAYRWAGLDPATGDPRGYGNDGRVLRVTDAETDNLIEVFLQPKSKAHYYGSAVPLYQGSMRNTFNYGSFFISANIQGFFGYWFRRPVSSGASNSTVSYSQLFEAKGNLQSADYANRWQKPGDEQFTNVPSQVFNASGRGFRDYFYQYSEVNVYKGDHIRLQEINLSYALNRPNWFLKNPRIYANITNLGILWRANNAGIDPQVSDFPQPRQYSFGFGASF